MFGLICGAAICIAVSFVGLIIKRKYKTNADFIVFAPKSKFCLPSTVAEISFRSSMTKMSLPLSDIIVTDEIFGEREVDCLVDSVRSGVKVMATAHACNIDNTLVNTFTSRDM